MASIEEKLRRARSAEDIFEALKRSSLPLDFFLEEKFNPFDHWKDDVGQLMEWKGMVDLAIETVTTRYHKGFNTSTANFSRILDGFTSLQANLRRIEGAMAAQPSRGGERSKQALQDLWYDAEVLGHMITTMDMVDIVAQTPELIRVLLHQKQYLHVIRLLNAAFALLYQSELATIEALSSVNTKLLEYRNTLQQTLVEELLGQLADVQRDPEADMAPLKLQFASLGRSTDKKGSVLRKTLQKRSLNAIKSARWGSASRSEGMQLHHTSDSALPYTELPAVLDHEDKETRSMWSDQTKDTGRLFAAEETLEYTMGPKADAGTYTAILVEALAQLDRLDPLVSSVLKAVSSQARLIMTHVHDAYRDAVLRETTKASSPRHQGPHKEKSDVEHVVELTARWSVALLRYLKNHASVIELLSHKNSNVLRHSMEGVYSKQTVWEKVQVEMWSRLKRYLTVHRRGSVSALPQHTPLVPSSEPILTFSFADAKLPSVALSQHKGGNFEKQQAAEQTHTFKMFKATEWISSSPYWVVELYQPVLQFTEEAASILGFEQETPNIESTLRSELELFVSKSYIPRVQGDAKGIEDVFSSHSAFALASSTRSSMMLECAVALDAVIEKLFQDYCKMPYDTKSFLNTVGHVLSCFISKCWNKMEQLDQGFASMAWAREDEVKAILRSEHSFPLREPDAPAPLPATTFIEKLWDVVVVRSGNSETLVEEQQLIWDTHILQMIVSMVASASILKQRMLERIKPLMQDREDGVNLQQLQRFDSFATTSLHKLITIGWCTLKLEMFLHAAYFVRASVLRARRLRKDPLQPDDMTTSLNKEVLFTMASLQERTTVEQRQYLTTSYAPFLLHALLESSSLLSRQSISSYSITQLTRNVTAMQQSLSTLLSEKGVETLDKAKQYWDLVLNRDLEGYAESHPDAFTPQQYALLAQLQTHTEE